MNVFATTDSEQIAVFNPLDLHRSSPECSDCAHNLCILTDDVREQIAVFNPLDLRWSSPECSDGAHNLCDGAHNLCVVVLATCLGRW